MVELQTVNLAVIGSNPILGLWALSCAAGGHSLVVERRIENSDVESSKLSAPTQTMSILLFLKK